MHVPIEGIRVAIEKFPPCYCVVRFMTGIMPKKTLTGYRVFRGCGWWVGAAAAYAALLLIKKAFAVANTWASS